MYNLFMNVAVVAVWAVVIVMAVNTARTLRRLKTAEVEYGTSTYFLYQLGAHQGVVRIISDERCFTPKLVRNPAGWDFVFPAITLEAEKLRFMHEARPYKWYGEQRLMDLEVFREVYLNQNRDVKIVGRTLMRIVRRQEASQAVLNAA